MESSANDFIQKMKREGLPELVIDTFTDYYRQLYSGERGYISEKEIEPTRSGSLTQLNEISRYSDKGESILDQSVMIKLNGGLGTSMGLSGPKCLLQVKDGLNFLDITALQIRKMRENNKDIPLVLMNSFSTEEKSTERLRKYPEIKTSLPFSFIQNKYPKVLKEDLTPAEHPENPELEWNPPGHGDIYTALKTSGMMDKLIDSGRKYCFVSNIDNLGATLDTSILGYFAENKIPFLMEVAKRTEMDKKGGHLAQKKDGGYLLREIAQTREEDIDKFQDINRFSYFNTNSIWINLEHLKELMDKHNGKVPLPLIVNSKTLDPRDSASPEVYQLETAMGSAVTLFDNADAIEIPRTRFKPVKKTNDLLLLRSDRYRINEKYELTESDEVTTSHTNVSLDSDYYKKIDMLDKRFPHGAPSMIDCTSLKVKGDVKFGESIKLKGDVEIVNTSEATAEIENNKTLSGKLEL